LRIDLLLLLGLAAILRGIALDSGLWFDEIVTLVESARLPLHRILTEFPGVNAHPLFSIFAHASISFFGESAWALRLPAVAFGVASVWAAFALATRVMSRAEAWAGAFLLAVSYHHIWFSQNARGYTLMGWCALVSTLYLLRARDSARSRDYVVYALVCAAGVYTHLTMAFVVAGHAAVILGGRVAGWRPALVHRWKPLLAAWAGAAVMSVAVYAPFFSGLAAHFGEARPVDAAAVATGGWALSEALHSILTGAGVPAAVLGGLVAGVGAGSLLRRAPLETLLLVTPAVVTAAAIVMLGQPMRPRFFFFLSGAAAVFAGRGFGVMSEALRPRSSRPAAAMVLSPAVVVALIAAPALIRNYRVPKQDFASVIVALEREEATGSRVAAVGPACFPLGSYYAKPWPCLQDATELRKFQAQSGRRVIVQTLSDYIAPSDLRSAIKQDCREVHRYPGTLGGGDIVICVPGGPS
jgi:hypothetical protein